MSDLPLVSIVVPVYNGEKYLRESLDSILAQTYQRTEILVMDDASTDGTSEIIKSYGEKIKSYRQLSNVGQFQNVNDGIGMASGEFVCVYHSDDIYISNIVEKEVEFLIKYPEAGAVFCLDILVDKDNKEYNRLKIPPEVQGGAPLTHTVIFNALLKYKNAFLVCPTAMVRKSVYDDVGVYRDELYLNTSDLDMWLRISQKYTIGILEEYLLRYRHFPDQSSRKYHSTRLEQERFFTIMDDYLQAGSENIATPEALTGYEAHRAEDRLMLIVKHYIQGKLDGGRKILKTIRLAQLLGSAQIQRWRLFVLYLLFHVLLRLPRMRFVVDLFIKRWFSK